MATLTPRADPAPVGRPAAEGVAFVCDQDLNIRWQPGGRFGPSRAVEIHGGRIRGQVQPVPAGVPFYIPDEDLAVAFEGEFGPQSGNGGLSSAGRQGRIAGLRRA